MNCCVNSTRILYEELPAILLREFDTPKNRSLSWRHFCPLNIWKNSVFWGMQDETTGDVYTDEGRSEKRLKCLSLTLITPVAQPLGLFLNVINRISKIIFILDSCTLELYPLVGRIKELFVEVIYIALSPIIFLGMEFAAIYGVFTPFNGGKLYASFESLVYGKDFLAPCFQPIY